MAEEIDLEKCTFRNFGSSVTLTLDRVEVTLVRICGRGLPTHQIRWKSEKLFVDVRTHLSSNLLGHRRGDDLKIKTCNTEPSSICILRHSTHNISYFHSATWMSYVETTTTTTVLQPFFRDHLGEPMPEENFWTLWCKGRLTEADTPTIPILSYVLCRKFF